MIRKCWFMFPHISLLLQLLPPKLPHMYYQVKFLSTRILKFNNLHEIIICIEFLIKCLLMEGPLLRREGPNFERNSLLGKASI